MHAVVMHEFGGPEVLSPDSYPAPVAPPGWVRVDLHASAVNWHDTLVRQGRYGSPLPHVPGADGAGVRADTGDEVIVMPSLFWGEREAAPGPAWEILGDHRPGTYAESVIVPADGVVPRPRGLSLEEAAALPLVGLTAFRALIRRGRLVAGERVLVLGASGGVATMAVALAAALGARVTVTSSSPAKIAAAVDRGADGGVDHRDPAWVEAARSATPDGQGFDLVLDPVGRWREAVACLRPGGRLVVLGASVATEAHVDIRPYYFGQYELIGTTMGSPRDMAGLLAFLDDHRVAPPLIDRVYPLDEAAAAHRRLEAGDGIGKIVLRHR